MRGVSMSVEAMDRGSGGRQRQWTDSRKMDEEDKHIHVGQRQ